MFGREADKKTIRARTPGREKYFTAHFTTFPSSACERNDLLNHCNSPGGVNYSNISDERLSGV